MEKETRMTLYNLSVAVEKIADRLEFLEARVTETDQRFSLIEKELETGKSEEDEDDIEQDRRLVGQGVGEIDEAENSARKD